MARQPASGAKRASSAAPTPENAAEGASHGALRAGAALRGLWDLWAVQPLLWLSFTRWVRHRPREPRTSVRLLACAHLCLASLAVPVIFYNIVATTVAFGPCSLGECMLEAPALAGQNMNASAASACASGENAVLKLLANGDEMTATGCSVRIVSWISIDAALLVVFVHVVWQFRSGKLQASADAAAALVALTESIGSVSTTSPLLQLPRSRGAARLRGPGSGPTARSSSGGGSPGDGTLRASDAATSAAEHTALEMPDTGLLPSALARSAAAGGTGSSTDDAADADLLAAVAAGSRPAARRLRAWRASDGERKLVRSVKRMWMSMTVAAFIVATVWLLTATDALGNSLVSAGRRSLLELVGHAYVSYAGHMLPSCVTLVLFTDSLILRLRVQCVRVLMFGSSTPEEALDVYHALRDAMAAATARWNVPAASLVLGLVGLGFGEVVTTLLGHQNNSMAMVVNEVFILTLLFMCGQAYIRVNDELKRMCGSLTLCHAFTPAQRAALRNDIAAAPAKLKLMGRRLDYKPFVAMASSLALARLKGLLA